MIIADDHCRHVQHCQFSHLRWITVSSDLKRHEHISNICMKATRTLNFVRRNTYCCSHDAKELAYLSLVCPHLEYAAAAWDPKTSSNSNEFNVVLPVLSEKIIAIQLMSLICWTNLLGWPWSNVTNTLVRRISTRRWITLRPFLWIISQFHHGIPEPPMTANLCHCQFAQMFSNINFFLGP